MKKMDNSNAEKPTIALISFALDDYNLSIGNTIHNYAKEHDCNFLVFLTSYAGNSSSIEEITTSIKGLITRHCVDGLIIPSSALNSYFPWETVKAFVESFHPLPVVLIGNELEGVPCVVEDNRGGMASLIRHMIDEHGYRKIAFVRGPLTSREGDERFNAYRDVLEEYGLSYDPELVVAGDFDFELSPEDSLKALKNLLDNRADKIDAIACSSDLMAYTVVNELTRRGISVPADIGVSGFDNATICSMMIPSLTTVDQNRPGQATEAVRLLLEKIANPGFCETSLVETSPVIRRSCNCFSFPRVILDHIHNGEYEGDLETRIIDYLNSDKELAALDLHSVADWKEKARLVLDQYKRGENGNTVDSINNLEKIIVNDVRGGGDVEVWSFLVSRIAQLTIAFEPISQSRHFRFYYTLLTIIGSVGKTMQLLKIMELRNEEILFHSMIESFVSCNDYASFIEILSSYLPRLGVNSCYICLYREKNMEEAQLLYGYNSRLERSFQHDSVFFPAFRLVPDYVDLFEERATFIVKDLYLQNRVCGYILFEREKIDIEVQTKIYEGLSHQISTVIGQINLHSKIQDYSRQLEQKVAERTAQLTETNRRLKKLDSVKNDFIANITHDFRSPLTVILNVADLELNMKKNSSSRKEFEMILASAYRMKHFVDRLLDLAKLDSDAISIQVSKIDLAAFLDTVSGYYTRATEGTGISISVNLPEKLRDDFYSDQEKLDEVISNVVSNALKHIDPEKGRIEISVEYVDNFCQIAISDNGSGIPPQYLKDIFERFKQLESGRDTRYGGSGIGLAFAKQLTEFMKGTIWAESEGPGAGATFFIRLPMGNVFEEYEFSDRANDSIQQLMRNTLADFEVKQKFQKDELHIDISNPNCEGQPDPYRALIMIADDEVQIAELIKGYLANRGYQNFILASGGRSALKALDMYSPDIIICDFNMPQVRGSDVLKRVMDDPEKREIPFLFLSAVADETLIHKQKDQGAREYLKKPIDEKELFRHVEHYLGMYLGSRAERSGEALAQDNTPVTRNQLTSYLNKVLSMRHWVDCSLMMMKIIVEEEEVDTRSLTEPLLASLGKLLREYDMSGVYEKDMVLIILPETSRENCPVVIEKISSHVSVLAKQLDLPASCHFGASSLFSCKGALEKDLGLDNLAEMYQVERREDANWDLIRTYKRTIGIKLLQYARGSLDNAIKENNEIVWYGGENSR